MTTHKHREQKRKPSSGPGRGWGWGYLLFSPTSHQDFFSQVPKAQTPFPSARKGRSGLGMNGPSKPGRSPASQPGINPGDELKLRTLNQDEESYPLFQFSLEEEEVSVW